MILTYHKIGRQFEIGITTVGRRKFADHLDLLLELGLKPVRAAEAAASDSRQHPVAITFDDGYESVYLAALPEMNERGIRATVFPVVESVGGYNTWDVKLSPRRFRHLSWPQICDLVRLGHAVGSHTMTHRDLTKLDPAVLRHELRASKAKIEDLTGVGVEAISYPFGKVSPRVIDEALEAGYSCGFTSSPNQSSNPMTIGRMGVYSIDNRRSLRMKLGLIRGYRLECLKTTVISTLALGTTLIKR